MSFLREYGGSLLVGAALAAVIVLIIVKLVRDKRTGKSCCGNCQSCGMCGCKKEARPEERAESDNK